MIQEQRSQMGTLEAGLSKQKEHWTRACHPGPGLALMVASREAFTQMAKNSTGQCFLLLRLLQRAGFP